MISGFTLSYFFGFWVFAYVADASLSAHHLTRQRYLSFRDRSGISVRILQAKFFTQKLNPFFQRLGEVDWFPWSLWFFIGTAFSAIFMVLSVVVLSLLAYNTIMKKPIEKQIITPVMPGVNLPMSHLGFYMLTLLICVVLHEAGHAIAALRERVRLHGFGFFLFGIYPGAYVDISDADLNSLSPLRQLKIYSAGVWHNGVIVIISVIVFYTLPWILSPAYATHRGVGVISLQQNSVFTGHRGLHLGDAITQVNSCPVNTPAEWFKCLQEADSRTGGYCVPGGYVASLGGQHAPSQPGVRRLAAVVPQHEEQLPPPIDGLRSIGASEPKQDCCHANLASTHLCFTYMVNSVGRKKPRYTCLPARAVTEREPCSVPSDCGRVALGGAENDDSRNHQQRAAAATSACLIPAPTDNTTRLIRIVHNRARSPAILFLGPVEELIASVEVSDYVPRWPQFTPCRLPHTIATFCVYLFSLSGALVLLNVVPCYALDGQWILKSLLEIVLPSFVCSRQIRRLIYATALYLGTGLLSLNLGLALWYLLLETTSGLPTTPHTKT